MILPLPHLTSSVLILACRPRNRNGMKAEQVFGAYFVFFLLTVSCYAASRPVENRLCQGPVPNTTQLCQVPCPIDCQVSPWGAWGPCTFENCEDQAGRKGGLHPQQRLPLTPTNFPRCWYCYFFFSFLVGLFKSPLQLPAYLTSWQPNRYLGFFIPAHIWFCCFFFALKTASGDSEESVRRCCIQYF